jgi:hypothetical protein
MGGRFRPRDGALALVGAAALGGGITLLVHAYSKDDAGARRSNASTGPLWVIPGVVLVLIGLGLTVYVLVAFLIRRKNNH